MSACCYRRKSARLGRRWRRARPRPARGSAGSARKLGVSERTFYRWKKRIGPWRCAPATGGVASGLSPEHRGGIGAASPATAAASQCGGARPLAGARPSRMSSGVWTSCTTPWPMGVRSGSWTVLDVYGRECVALVAAQTFSGGEVARVLTAAGAELGLPKRITVDSRWTIPSSRASPAHCGASASRYIGS
jgi:hypothetical protein